MQDTYYQYDINYVLENDDSSFWTKRYDINDFEMQNFYFEYDDDKATASKFLSKLKDKISKLIKFEESFLNHIYTISITIDIPYIKEDINNKLFDTEFLEFEKKNCDKDRFESEFREYNYCKNAYIMTHGEIFFFVKYHIDKFFTGMENTVNNVNTNDDFILFYNFAILNELQTCALNWLIQYLSEFCINSCVIFPALKLETNSIDKNVKLELKMDYNELLEEIHFLNGIIYRHYVLNNNCNIFLSICQLFNHGNLPKACFNTYFIEFPLPENFLENFLLFLHVLRFKLSFDSIFNHFYVKEWNVRCGKIRKLRKYRNLHIYKQKIDDLKIFHDLDLTFEFDYNKYLFASFAPIRVELSEKLKTAKEKFVNKFTKCIVLAELIEYESVIQEFIYNISYIYCNKTLKTVSKLKNTQLIEILYKQYEFFRNQIVLNIKNSLYTNSIIYKLKFSDIITNIIKDKHFDITQQNMLSAANNKLFALLGNFEQNKTTNFDVNIIDTEHSTFSYNRKRLLIIKKRLVIMAINYQHYQEDDFDFREICQNTNVYKIDTLDDKSASISDPNLLNTIHFFRVICTYQEICFLNNLTSDTIEMELNLLDEHSKIMVDQKSLRNKNKTF
ncbi:hypothetical protein COBT_002086 [Conglomerata obtusa]